ncbi:MAG: ABC transporter permease [Firmicutes bacterium]|nr:ABC transporter permease [Bacillota bacterium]
MSAQSPTLPSVNPGAPSMKKRKRRKGNWSKFFHHPRAIAGLIILAFFVLLAILAPVLAPYNPQANIFIPLQPPSWQHLLGTTNTGQDIFSQFVWGAQTTLMVSLIGGGLSLIIGLLMGMYAGYRGGWIDGLLNSVSNIFLVLPSLALLIVIESYVKGTSPLIIGMIIGLTGWAFGARVFRSQTMSLANRDFVVAAKLSGMSDLRIMFGEILPNMSSIVATSLMYGCLGAMLAETGLAFLGYEGMSTSSWGVILYMADGGGAMLSGAWWWFVPPGLAVALVGTSFSLMNFAMDQITNPRLANSKRRRKSRVANSGT